MSAGEDLRYQVENYKWMAGIDYGGMSEAGKQYFWEICAKAFQKAPGMLHEDALTRFLTKIAFHGPYVAINYNILTGQPFYGGGSHYGIDSKLAIPTANKYIPIEFVSVEARMVSDDRFEWELKYKLGGVESISKYTANGRRWKAPDIKSILGIGFAYADHGTNAIWQWGVTLYIDDYPIVTDGTGVHYETVNDQGAYVGVGEIVLPKPEVQNCIITFYKSDAPIIRSKTMFFEASAGVNGFVPNGVFPAKRNEIPSYGQGGYGGHGGGGGAGASTVLIRSFDVAGVDYVNETATVQKPGSGGGGGAGGKGGDGCIIVYW